MSIYNPVVVNKLRPLGDNVIISDMNFNERVTSSGVILRKDNAKLEGIKPRWGKVFAIGPDQVDVVVGQWVLIDHGRWTRGVMIQNDAGEEFTIRKVDTKDILMVSDSEDHPLDDDIRKGL